MAGRNSVIALVERITQGWAHFRLVEEEGLVDSILVGVNGALAHSLGMEEEDLLGKRWSELCSQGVVPAWHEAFSRTEKGDMSNFPQECFLEGKAYRVSAYADGPGHWGAVFYSEERETSRGDSQDQETGKQLSICSEILAFLVQLFQDPVSSPPQLWEVVLKHGVRLSRSQAAYVQYYDEDKMSYAVEAYSSPTGRIFDLEEDPLLSQVEMQSLWEHAIKEREAFFQDDPHALRAFVKEGSPRGVKPERILAAPVFRGGRMTLVVMVNGSPPGQALGLLELDLLIHGVLGAVEHYQVEAALERQLAFEKLVADIAALFVDLSPHQLHRGITYALETCGHFFGVDRSYVFLLSRDGRTMSNTHEWSETGIESLKDLMQDFPVDRLSWWMEKIRTLKPVYVGDVEHLPPGAAAERKRFRRQGIRTVLGIPIAKAGVLQGFMGFDAVRKERTWTEGQIALLQVVAELISSALARHQAQERIRYLSFRDQLTGLYNRTYFHEELRRLEKSRSYPITIISVDIDGLKLINDSLGHDQGDEMLVSAARVLGASVRQADVAARVGGDEFALIIPRTDHEVGQTIVRRIRQRLQEHNHKREGLPLSFSLGMATAYKEGDALEPTHKEADGRMYQDKLSRHRGQRIRLIEALMDTLAQRYYVTEGDVEENARRCMAVGEILQLSSDQLFNLSLLAHAHDLGKVGIPDQIINKTGDLDAGEWEIMHQHPEKGYRIAISSPDMAEIAHLILKHHEHWDGSGYPQGLSGEEIPMECRILAVVTAFSAMTHDRPYREPRSHQAALTELQRCAGLQFDPRVVKAFIQVMEQEGT